MRKSYQSVLCSHSSIAFTLTAALLLAAVVMSPARALAKDNNNAYVPNNNGTVSVIDAKTDTVIATIPAGFNHPFCATMSPNGKLVYVCNQPNSIGVIDTATNTVTASITLPGAVGFLGNEGANPVVAFSRNGERAFVIASGGGVNSTLYTIDTENNTVVSSTSFGKTFLLAIAVSPNGDNIYLASQAPILSQSGILVVDVDGDEPTKTIALGHLIFDLALSRNGDRLYASDVSGLVGGQSGVLVVDTDTSNIVTTVPLPNNVFVTGLALTPDGRHLYACDFTLTRPANSTVTVIDTNDNSVDTTIAAPNMTFTAIAASRNGHKMLVVNSVLSLTVNSTVAVIDTHTNTIDDTVAVERFPIAIATQQLKAHGDDDDHDKDSHDKDDNH
ncbi:MAG TPA: YncE family protein [Candidatus Angelobacter sp.]|nr:YncE family protein [Candidatus Angelobacter sp.]